MRYILILLTFCSLQAANTYVVGICGGSCSGKTTFANQLKHLLSGDIAYLPQDAYYKEFNHLSPEEKRELNYDHPDIIDFRLLCKQIKMLKSENEVMVPIYSFETDSREPGGELVQPKKVILVDGHLIFANPELRELLDLKIFIDTDQDVRCIRRVMRDLSLDRGIENTANQYLNNISPMFEAFIRPMKNEADIIVNGNVNQPAAVDVIAAKLREHL